MSRALYEVAEQGGKFLIEKAAKSFSKKGTTELLERGVKQGIEEIGGTKVSPQALEVYNKLPDPENFETIKKAIGGENSEDAYEALNDLGHNGIAGNDAAAKMQAQDMANPARKAANVTPRPEPPPVHNLAD